MLGGYHINSFLSVEAELSYRHLGLGAYDCCQHLFLGADGNRYFAPVAGMNSCQYRDLRSSVSLYGLGARLDVGFVWLFYPQCRCCVLVTPSILSLVSSSSV